MSRIAKKPIEIPSGVTVTIQGKHVTVKGAKGQVEYDVHGLVAVELTGNTLHVAPIADLADAKAALRIVDNTFVDAILGTTRANLQNAVTGVSAGYSRKLLLVGVGFRGQVQGKTLHLSLGFSHPVLFQIPEGITIEMPSQTEIIVQGIDKRVVGQVAADIRAKRPVEPYKGKGVRYSDEIVSLKETKKK